VELESINGVTLGAEASDFALRELDGASAAELDGALAEHALLVFRNQHLGRDEHVELALRLGAIDEFDTRVPNVTRTPYVARPPGTPVIVEATETGPSAGDEASWEPWRSDGSFKDPPVTLSIRAAVAVNGDAGTTEVADLRAAYDALSPAMRDRLEGLTVWHSAVWVRAALGEVAVEPTADPTELPGAAHPLVRRHPATGRRALFLGQNACHVLGMEQAEAGRLLEDLTREACSPPRVYAHEWRPGDVLLWDCRSVVHRTSTPGRSAVRTLRHVSVVNRDGAIAA
jgi:alpha-ketoglutarate-dependent 2,4-dichlorophenoxyacetate dioxygenase